MGSHRMASVAPSWLSRLAWETIEVGSEASDTKVGIVVITATREHQELLLEIQALISAVGQWRREHDAVATAKRVRQARADAIQARAERDDEVRQLEVLNRAVADLEKAIVELASDIEVKEEQLLAGVEPQSEADRLARMLDILRERRVSLEETLVETVEERDEKRADADEAERVLTAAVAENHAAQVYVRDQRESLVAQINEAETQRQELRSRLDAELRELFEKLVAEHGVGAARLDNGTCSATGLPLSPKELAAIAELGEEELAFCPHTGIILVRERGA